MPINYDEDLKKHYVRSEGWLAAAKHRGRRARRSRGLRYLTFCAVQAVDVYMLDLHKIIVRDRETDRYESVYFCERDEASYEEISRQLGGNNGFYGEFVDIVLFEDDERTKGHELLDDFDVRDAEHRERLRLKDVHRNFKDSFPFDVLNLDLEGSIFPADQTIESEILEALRKLLEWQTSPPSGAPSPNEFSLFLTTKVDSNHLSKSATTSLIDLVDANCARDKNYADAFLETFQSDAKSLARGDLTRFMAVSLPKQLLEEAMKLGWNMLYRGVFVYQRPRDSRPYEMLSVVVHFKRASGIQLAHAVAAEAIKIVKAGAVNVDDRLGDDEQRTRIQTDLDAVLAHRKGLE